MCSCSSHVSIIRLHKLNEMPYNHCFYLLFMLYINNIRAGSCAVPGTWDLVGLSMEPGAGCLCHNSDYLTTSGLCCDISRFLKIDNFSGCHTLPPPKYSQINIINFQILV